MEPAWAYIGTELPRIELARKSWSSTFFLESWKAALLLLPFRLTMAFRAIVLAGVISSFAGLAACSPLEIRQNTVSPAANSTLPKGWSYIGCYKLVQSCSSSRSFC